MDASLPQVDFRMPPPAASSGPSADITTDEGFAALLAALTDAEGGRAERLRSGADVGQSRFPAHAGASVSDPEWAMPDALSEMAEASPDRPEPAKQDDSGMAAEVQDAQAALALTGAGEDVAAPDHIPLAEARDLGAYVPGSGGTGPTTPEQAFVTHDPRPAVQDSVPVPQPAEPIAARPAKPQVPDVQKVVLFQPEAQGNPAPAHEAVPGPNGQAVPVVVAPGGAAVWLAPVAPASGTPVSVSVSVMPGSGPAEPASLPVMPPTGLADPLGAGIAAASAAGAAPAASPAATIAPPPFAPAPVVQQIAGMVEAAREGVLEITLAPAELGRVSLRMQPGEGGMVVSVMAERGETLDLLRRHAADLGAELRDMGYADVSFSFGQHRGRASETGAEGAAQSPVQDDAVAPGVVVALGAGAGLDLRL